MGQRGNARIKPASQLCFALYVFERGAGQSWVCFQRSVGAFSSFFSSRSLCSFQKPFTPISITDKQLIGRTLSNHLDAAKFA